MKYKLAETDIYDFAGWLTTREGVMKVGASSDANTMAEAVGEYIKTFPERFSALPQRNGLTEQQIKYLLSEYIKTFPNRFSALQQRPWVGLTEQQIEILLSDSKCWIGDDCSMPNLNYIIRAVEKAHGIGEK